MCKFPLNTLRTECALSPFPFGASGAIFCPLVNFVCFVAFSTCTLRWVAWTQTRTLVSKMDFTFRSWRTFYLLVYRVVDFVCVSFYGQLLMNVCPRRLLQGWNMYRKTANCMVGVHCRWAIYCGSTLFAHLQVTVDREQHRACHWMSQIGSVAFFSHNVTLTDPPLNNQ